MKAIYSRLGGRVVGSIVGGINYALTVASDAILPNANEITTESGDKVYPLPPEAYTDYMSDMSKYFDKKCEESGRCGSD